MDSQAGRIVVGYDGSAHSGAALDWAAAEAERRLLPLTVLFVVDCMGIMPGPAGPSPWRPDLAEKAATRITSEGVERARKTAETIGITAVTHVARVAYTLIQSSRDAAQLVVGTRGHGDVTGAMFGSVAFAVTAHAHCPVVVVRGDSARPSDPQRPVLVGVDGSACSDAAVRYATDAAVRTSAPLIVVTAYRFAAHEAWAGEIVFALESDGGPHFDTVAREAAQEAVAAAVRVASERHPELDVRERVVEGSAAEVLVAAAAGCGLVVVGSRGHGGFAGLMLGSVSHGLIHAAPCPVAIVRESAAPAAPAAPADARRAAEADPARAGGE
jgi:nucleotide-binding universal stress UspA family protein